MSVILKSDAMPYQLVFEQPATLIRLMAVVGASGSQFPTQAQVRWAEGVLPRFDGSVHDLSFFDPYTAIYRPGLDPVFYYNSWVNMTFGYVGAMNGTSRSVIEIDPADWYNTLKARVLLMTQGQGHLETLRVIAGNCHSRYTIDGMRDIGEDKEAHDLELEHQIMRTALQRGAVPYKPKDVARKLKMLQATANSSLPT